MPPACLAPTWPAEAIRQSHKYRRPGGSVPRIWRSPTSSTSPSTTSSAGPAPSGTRPTGPGSRTRPKVFIPLTMLCRDKCGYCTFAKAPARLDAPYLTPERGAGRSPASGAEAGCHEALFTLGERPEERYPVARDWLDDHGYGSTIDYLEAMCRLVLDETGLLPHANAGALFPEELAQLRPVSASQGMMIETLRDDLAAHRGAPDKTPGPPAGHPRGGRPSWRIPFTTGILVGIGEDRADRVRGPGGHRRQPRPARPRAGGDRPELPAQAGHGHAPRRRRARPTNSWRRSPWPGCILPPEVHVQAPPNLSDDFGALLDAGIDDWGGVSPVTADHVNPERPWPALDVLRAVDRGSGASTWRPGSPSTPSSPRARTGGSTPACASRCWTAATPTGWAATTRARSSRRRSASTRTSATAPRSSWSAGARPSGTRARTCIRPACCPGTPRAGGRGRRGAGRRAPGPGAGRGRAGDPVLGPGPRGGRGRRAGRRAAGRGRRATR